MLEALAFARGEADHEDLLAADGYVLGTTANFGYMSGAMKHVFDSTFLQVGGALSDDGSADGTRAIRGSDRAAAVRALRARPLRHHRAVRSVLSITGALGWKQGYDVLEVMGDVTGADTDSAYELGGTIAALLAG